MNGAQTIAAVPDQRVSMLGVDEEQEWKDVLSSCAHDFYHLPEYHRLAELSGEGTARLFVYREGEDVIALPLLLRAIRDVPGLEAEAGDWQDATSVYGYGGPIASHLDPPESILQGYRIALTHWLTEIRVVAVFSRLHPLFAQRSLLAGLGECVPAGQTVSIDLTLSPEEQRAQYSGTYRTRLNKLSRNGITCALDPEQRHLAEFVDMYHETMRRVNAHGSYFFGSDYFTGLSLQLGSTLQLFITRCGDQIIAGGLFTLCAGIVQYHLGATRDAFLKLSPMGLVIDTARLWGNEQGAQVLHLGGGVGSREDSLFCFKAGFSERRHRFETWRWVIAPELYQGLGEERVRSNELTGVEAISAGYFPAYRCPTVPRVVGASAPVASAVVGTLPQGGA